jgi:hypothetical protein
MRIGGNENGFISAERGSTLLMVVFCLFVLFGMAAFAVDLANFFVVRSEAQRAADAAALAGATLWGNSPCVSSTTGCSSFQTQAQNEAIGVGDQNLVNGVSPNIQSGDISFDFSVANDPRITVTVQMTSSRGDAVPTFFGKVLGVSTVDVRAQATAEAYNPGSNGPGVGTYCMKPWLFPNCDPSNTGGANANPVCPGNDDYYVEGSIGSQTIPNPSVIGSLLTIKPGNPQQAVMPSQYYPVNLPPGTAPPECPSCANGQGGGGGALYRTNIECCNTNTFTCGQQVNLSMETGNVVGPTKQGVDCLINEGPNGTGQDVLSTTSTNPFSYTITGGANNPNSNLVGQTVSTSSSLVSLPLFQPISSGQILCPGSSCGATVNIVGFMQLFVKQETSPQGTVNAYIINISRCGSSGGSGGAGGGGTIVGGAVAPVPVRLIHN